MYIGNRRKQILAKVCSKIIVKGDFPSEDIFFGFLLNIFGRFSLKCKEIFVASLQIKLEQYSTKLIMYFRCLFIL